VKMFDAGKTRMIGLPCGEKNYDDMLSRFHLIPERNVADGQTDRQTDRQICYINIARLGIIPACDRRTDRRTSCHGIVRAMHTRRVRKNEKDIRQNNY